MLMYVNILFLPCFQDNVSNLEHPTNTVVYIYIYILIVFCSFQSGTLKAMDAVPLVSLPLLWVLTMTEPHVYIRQTPLEHTMHGR